MGYSVKMTHNGNVYQKKDDILIQQLTELWTNYGDLVELWYDGGYDLGPEMVRRWTFPRDRFIF